MIVSHAEDITNPQPRNSSSSFCQTLPVPWSLHPVPAALAVLGGVWCGVGASFALDPTVAVTQYVEQRWRAPQPLPHDNVTTVAQTRDGYIWIGTVEGLARFDGVRSVVFDTRTTPELGGNWIRTLLEDSTGRLWIGTYGGGLSCLDQGRFVEYGAEAGLSSDVILSLAEDPSGTIWVGTGSGLFRRGPDDRFALDDADGARSGTSVKALLAEDSGGMWVGTSDGLFHRRSSSWDVPAGIGRVAVNALAGDGTALWVGTDAHGLVRLQDGRSTTWTTQNGLAYDRVWTLLIDSAGNLWIGTDGGGLQRLLDSALQTLDTTNGLRNNYVWALLEDREGGLWIGTNGGGVLRLSEGRATTWTTREGLATDFVWAVAPSGRGTLLVGTEEAGLLELGPSGVSRIPYAPSSIKVVIARTAGGVWVGGHDGVVAIDQGRASPLPPDELRAATVNTLLEDRFGRLWIGTNAGGLLRWADGHLERVEVTPSRSISSLLEARDGTFWVGGLGEVTNLLPDGTRRSWTRAEGLPSDSITGLFEGPEGPGGDALWISSRGGLARLRHGQIETLTTAQGLADDGIMLSRLARDGTVWLGGNRGLSAVALDDLELVLDGRLARVDPVVLGLEDGLRSLEVNGAGSSSHEDESGFLWFATRGGLTRVDPSRLAERAPAPLVLIEEVLADGRLLPANRPWLLPAATRRLELHFTALSMFAPTRARLRHRLDGFDPGWIESPRHRAAEYTNLPHGRYQFRVIAANADGVWNESGASVTFEIARHAWDKTWFRLVAIVLLVLLSFAFYLVRMWRLRQRTAELERLVGERTQALELANVQLARLAREDGLTGIANRRTFDEIFAAEWRRAARAQTGLAVLLLDVDAFKAYNDQVGHLAGDDTLRQVAGALAATFRRAGDLVARYGGEEFVILLTSIAAQEARAAAETARLAVFHLAVPHHTNPAADRVSVSVGVAWCQPADGGTPEKLLAAADQALYAAKQKGRNRVEVVE